MGPIFRFVDLMNNARDPLKLVNALLKKKKEEEEEEEEEERKKERKRETQMQSALSKYILNLHYIIPN